MFSSPRIQDEGTLPEPGLSWPVSPKHLVPKISATIEEFQARLSGITDYKMGIPMRPGAVLQWGEIERLMNEEAAAQEDLADVWLRAYDSAN